MASYTKQIPAGGEGTVSVKVDTNGYGGRTLTKTIVVQTNDKVRPNLTLTISGNVDYFAAIEPKERSVRLNGPADEKLTGTVTITPIEKYPFKIVESKTNRGEKGFEFKLDEVKKDKAIEYRLTVENVLKTKGNYFDTIILKTDSPIKPELRINVYGNIQEPKAQAAQATPPQTTQPLDTKPKGNP